MSTEGQKNATTGGADRSAGSRPLYPYALCMHAGQLALFDCSSWLYSLQITVALRAGRLHDKITTVVHPVGVQRIVRTFTYFQLGEKNKLV
jgi:hypothetical protein